MRRVRSRGRRSSGARRHTRLDYVDTRRDGSRGLVRKLVDGGDHGLLVDLGEPLLPEHHHVAVLKTKRISRPAGEGQTPRTRRGKTTLTCSEQPRTTLNTLLTCIEGVISFCRDIWYTSFALETQCSRVDLIVASSTVW